jgi:hypothetical protein
LKYMLILHPDDDTIGHLHSNQPFLRLEWKFWLNIIIWIVQAYPLMVKACSKVGY